MSCISLLIINLVASKQKDFYIMLIQFIIGSVAFVMNVIFGSVVTLYIRSKSDHLVRNWQNYLVINGHIFKSKTIPSSGNNSGRYPSTW